MNCVEIQSYKFAFILKLSTTVPFWQFVWNSSFDINAYLRCNQSGHGQVIWEFIMLMVQHSKGSKARRFISLKVYTFIHVCLIRLVIRKPKYWFCFCFFFGGGGGVISPLLMRERFLEQNSRKTGFINWVHIF